MGETRNPKTGKRREVKVSAINAREMVRCPTGEEPLDWLLLTDYRVENFAQAREAVSAYSLRWRIEDFHRTWKSSHCNVEDSQLRSERALRKWILIMATVATPIRASEAACANNARPSPRTRSSPRSSFIR